MPTTSHENETADAQLPHKLAALLGVNPRLASRFARLYAEVMAAPAGFSPAERAAVAAVAATAQGSTYVADFHEAHIQGAGDHSALAVATMADEQQDASGISPCNRELCRVAAKLSATPTRMTPEDWQPLITLGTDQLGLIEVAYVVGLANYMTRLADGFGLQGSETFGSEAIDLSGQQLEPATAHPSPDREPIEDRRAGDARTHRRNAGDVEARGEVQALGWFLKVAAPGSPPDSPYNFGYRSEMGMLLSAHPRIGPAFWELFSEIMFERGVLSRGERELVAAVAAAAQDCHY